MRGGLGLELATQIVVSVAVLTAVAAGVTAAAAAPDAPPSPLPQREIAPMLKIAWQRGPNLPQGFQDSDVGLVGTNLITACGFCQGGDDSRKPGHYPRGFLNKVWAFDIAAPDKGWVSLPDHPATPRQGIMGTTIGGAFYCWGGFNYSAPNCYADGYRLSRLEHGHSCPCGPGKSAWAPRKDDEWTWDALPSLPWPLTAAGICSIGSRIYMFGGADYEEDFSTNADRHGHNPRLGARLLVFDTRAIEGGWKRLTDCPGTPRLGMAVAAVGGKIYVIGGASAGGPGKPYRSVVDNWRYDVRKDKWERTRDLPTSSSIFPDNKIVFAARYILLVGGFQYREVANPDGSVRPAYGTPHKFADQGEYFNDVFVYDTHADLFGAADPLPINNATPMTLVRGNEIFVLGGESDPREIDGEYYGHHPDLFLQGKITLAK